jgi:hypothetical protein
VIPPLAQVPLLGRGPGPLRFLSGRMAGLWRRSFGQAGAPAALQGLHLSLHFRQCHCLQSAFCNCVCFSPLQSCVQLPIHLEHFQLTFPLFGMLNLAANEMQLLYSQASAFACRQNKSNFRSCNNETFSLPIPVHSAYYYFFALHSSSLSHLFFVSCIMSLETALSVRPSLCSSVPTYQLQNH